jgi:hypothetical protein
MSRIFYMILAGALFSSCAQKSIPKVYGYRQPVLQGANPARIANEGGKEVEVPVKPRVNTMIFLESRTANVEVKGVWIKGQPYAVKTEVISTTPVMAQAIRPGAPQDTLVPYTSNKVFAITPLHAGDAITPSPSLQKKIEGNELVVHCVINGKNRYYTSEAIKNLAPLALQ